MSKSVKSKAVFRKHQGRKQELQRGKIVGSHDKQVVWHKPKTCPKGLTKEEFARLPKTLTVREVHYYIAIPGFRTQQVSLITTLLDVKNYSTLELVKLYEFRWQVELDLKHLKTTWGMDILRSKTERDGAERNLYLSVSLQSLTYLDVGIGYGLWGTSVAIISASNSSASE